MYDQGSCVSEAIKLFSEDALGIGEAEKSLFRCNGRILSCYLVLPLILILAF